MKNEIIILIFLLFRLQKHIHSVKMVLVEKSVKEVLSWLSAQFVKKLLISETT
ncbi:hypothetical protein RUMHYD_00499 [Blautia hydrogenotrophica DSM 10507]|uniref:Uncharacterized protein n=1 Tax=Blautia hydrogenotrophica (strain DSM 10507 / JCM 14656 / S5a33) TaxID=476272 RepID=C0CI35_BLAHS|nr:hypothetical protein RUMHYD_00499 [Blautia hydrogenotrophica DSM 10507]